MSLYIISRAQKSRDWHIGEGMPYEDMQERVIIFQADGDELDMILRAMEQTRVAAVLAAPPDVSMDRLTDGRIRTEPGASDPADDGPEVEAIRNVRRLG